MPTTSTHAVPDRNVRIGVGMLVLYVAWGSTYLAIALAVRDIPPFLMAGVRFGLAGFILVGWQLARERRDIQWPSRREWRDSAIVGALLLGGGMGMVSFAEQTVPSGIAALMVSLMPVWIAILGAAVFHERLPRLAGLGIVVGFIGVAILVAPSVLGTTGALDPIGLVALLISPLCWSVGSIFASHRARLPRRPLMASAAQMVTGSLVLLAMGVLAGEPSRFAIGSVGAASLFGFLYLVVVGSLLAFTTFGWLLRNAPLPLISTYAYVNPVVAVILGAILLGEPVEPRLVVAGGVIVAGVALIVTARGRMARPSTAAETDRTATLPAPAPTTEAAV